MGAERQHIDLHTLSHPGVASWWDGSSPRSQHGTASHSRAAPGSRGLGAG